MRKISVIMIMAKSRKIVRMMMTPMKMKREVSRLLQMRPCLSTICLMMSSISKGC